MDDQWQLMKASILILLFCLMMPVQAVELFGVKLLESSRDQLRNAVKKSGVELISESGDDSFFDVYASGDVLQGSRYLYLGFVKKDNRFAFAEYEFDGLQPQVMLEKLIEKYGKASKTTGQFITDQAFSWKSDGITIGLYTDWSAYKTRLTYHNPDTLNLLKLEQQKHFINRKQQDAKDQKLVY